MSNQWYPFFPGDYARDTVHLSLMEDCYYRRLLDYYYSTGGPLPADQERLQRVCRAFSPEERTAVQFILSEFFEERESGLHNTKADSVIAKAREVSDKRAEAARKSHERRAIAGKNDANAGANADGHANAGKKHAIAEKNDANGGAKTVHPQPQPQEPYKPPPIRADMPMVERMLREMVEEKRDFIRSNFGLDDGEINIHLEEMVVKTRDRSPGPDLWLYISKFLKNRKDDIHGKQQRIASGAAAPGGKEKGYPTRPQGTGRGGVDAGKVRDAGPAGAFEDRSDEWADTAV